jgi:hypothetical protein
VSNALRRWTGKERTWKFAVECWINTMLAADNSLEGPRPVTSIMPMVWCVVTTAIIASGFAVTLGGGPVAAGFAVQQGGDFKQALALYAVFAASLGVAFMFVPKATNWRIHKGLAWSTFMLAATGGVMMLVVPQILLNLARGYDMSAALVWSAAWMEAGERISMAGGLVALAAFFGAWLRRGAT